MLETVRRRLRSLIKLIVYKKREFVYSDFEDEIGAGADIEVSGVPVGTDMDRFRAKARHTSLPHSQSEPHSYPEGRPPTAVQRTCRSKRPDAPGRGQRLRLKSVNKTPIRISGLRPGAPGRADPTRTFTLGCGWHCYLTVRCY
jgi:hypothetical protein